MISAFSTRNASGSPMPIWSLKWYIPPAVPSGWNSWRYLHRIFASLVTLYLYIYYLFGGGTAKLFRALDLKSEGPWFKSSTLLLFSFVLSSPKLRRPPDGILKCSICNIYLLALSPTMLHVHIFERFPQKIRIIRMINLFWYFCICLVTNFIQSDMLQEKPNLALSRFYAR